MPVIGDSSAVLEVSRMLPQHQAAITLLDSALQNPEITNFNWLDLACGKGQIISQLNENLSSDIQKKIFYHGYDINSDYLKIVDKIAENLDFNNHKVYVGDLTSLDKILPSEAMFDFVTCTNVAHEIHPQKFFQLIFSILKRLNENGQVFIYDMESLSQLELGALPLNSNDIQILLDAVLHTAGSDFKISTSKWSHKTCKGWSLVINRKYLRITNDKFEENHSKILEVLHDKIKKMLEDKLKECTNALNSFTVYGTETSADEEQKIRALYEFWALNRALEELA